MCGRLIDGAKILGLPVLGTEQYPQGLGPTVPELAERLGTPPSKLTFSCGGCPGLFRDLPAHGVHNMLVCGIEAHVCVQQTVLDLLADGWRVYIAADAVGSRFDVDYRIALERMAFRRGHADHHRGRVVRVVRSRRHAGVQTDQPTGSRIRAVNKASYPVEQELGGELVV